MNWAPSRLEERGAQEGKNLQGTLVRRGQDAEGCHAEFVCCAGVTAQDSASLQCRDDGVRKPFTRSQELALLD